MGRKRKPKRPRRHLSILKTKRSGRRHSSILKSKR